MKSSKRVKSEEEDKGSGIIIVMSDTPPTSPPDPSSPDPVTPLPPPTGEKGFLSARRRTPVKSQTPKHQATPTRPRPQTPADDTENPLTDIAGDKTLVSNEGFLSARRGRPHQLVKLEYQVL